MKNTDYDIVIAGAGLAGASLACLLKGSRYRALVVDSKPLDIFSQGPNDSRGIALSSSSKKILQTSNIWASFESVASPIEHIHVSQKDSFGITRIHASDEKIEALGYVLTLSHLTQGFHKFLQQDDSIQMKFSCDILDLQNSEDNVDLQLSKNGKKTLVSTKLLIASDGINSNIRKKLSINTSTKNYGQSAIVANIETSEICNSWAYERFTKSGPLALLPNKGNEWILVWTLPSEEAGDIFDLDNETFLKLLQGEFGSRCGAFLNVCSRQQFPLIFTRAQKMYYKRTVLLGNAAHSFHPVAGQGFNLTLRDSAVLAELLDSSQKIIDPGDMKILQQYSQWREKDSRKVARFTDFLGTIFTYQVPPLPVLRSCALFGMDLFPKLRKKIVRTGMGVEDRLPRLACGIPLSYQL